MRIKRVPPPVYLLGSTIAMLGLHRWYPIFQIVPGLWRWIGLLPAATGIVLGASAVRAFMRRGTTLIPGESSTSIVTEGPFRLTRNPMYLGMVLVLAGIALGLGSISPWFMLPLFIAVISVRIIPMEEAMMAGVFGESYSAYKSRVGRWI